MTDTTDYSKIFGTDPNPPKRGDAQPVFDSNVPDDAPTSQVSIEAALEAEGLTVEEARKRVAEAQEQNLETLPEERSYNETIDGPAKDNTAPTTTESTDAPTEVLDSLTEEVYAAVNELKAHDFGHAVADGGLKEEEVG
jgi:hypothetical protein